MSSHFHNKLSPAEDFKIDKSKTKNRLGQGQYGEVWKGSIYNQPVAIKILKMDGTRSYADLTDDLTREANFLLENSCPSIVLLVRVCFENNNLMLATELLDGDLESWHKSHDLSNIPLGKKISLIVDAARGVNFMHHFGVVHCDIKPANIFIDSKSWRAKLGDLGLAMHKEEDFVPTGTPLFSSPEVLLDEKQPGDLYSKVDVFSLASTTAWVVNNGGRVFSPNIVTYKQLVRHVCHENHRPVIRENIPASLTKLLEAAWEASPHTRIDSDEFLKRIGGSCYYDCHFADSMSSEWWKLSFTEGEPQVDSTEWVAFIRKFLIVSDKRKQFNKSHRKQLEKDVCDSDGKVSLDKFADLCNRLGPVSELSRNLRHLYSLPYFPHEQDVILNTMANGTYFLRDSTQKGSWSFVFTSHDTMHEIEHLRISYNPRSAEKKKWYAGSDMRRFSNLRSLFEHYQTEFRWTTPLTEEMLKSSSMYH